MDNPKTMATLAKQATGGMQTKYKQPKTSKQSKTKTEYNTEN